MKALVLNALFGLTISVSLIAAGCSESEPQGIPEDEIAMFEKKLMEGATFAEACEELDVLCKSTGFGCTAHSVFCKVPTKDYICQQLGAACVNYPAACDVYNDYCPDDKPVMDGGGIIPDAQDPRKDAGPMKFDNSVNCIADDPDTPLVNEDTCGSEGLCVNGDCQEFQGDAGPLRVDTGDNCIADDPDTPLVNEDTCGLYETCINGTCQGSEKDAGPMKLDGPGQPVRDASPVFPDASYVSDLAGPSQPDL